MKIWIAKNSEVPVREQLITQITLGIVAGDFTIGERLPSTREIARRCGLHANTVGSAYQKLVEQGLLEFRKGSGFYIAQSAGDQIAGVKRLEQLIDELINAARSLDIDEKDLVNRIRRRGGDPKSAKSVIVVESDPGLREILVSELTEHFPGVIGTSLEEFPSGKVSGSVVAAMVDERQKLDGAL